jgi:hypothetical protein
LLISENRERPPAEVGWVARDFKRVQVMPSCRYRHSAM